jgi:hypothetical protein
LAVINGENKERRPLRWKIKDLRDKTREKRSKMGGKILNNKGVMRCNFVFFQF